MTREEAIQLLKEIDSFYCNGLHLISSMRENGDSAMTHAAIVRYMKYRQALEMAKEALENCEDALFYDEDDAAEFIHSETGIGADIIEKVLDAEMKYMASVGIAEMEGE